MDTQPHVSIAEFQTHIGRRYGTTDRARGTAPTFLWFIEEVGELATELQRSAAPSDDTDAAGQRQNLKEEFADVLAWLCTLANINDVDLTEAVRGKYLQGPGPAGHK